MNTNAFWAPLQVVLLTTPLLVASTSHGRLTQTCLTGTDTVAVANDASQITAVRGLIDAACDCATYDGTKGHARSDYVKCAVPIIKAQVAANALRAQCASTVKKIYKNSTCGIDPAVDAGPCIKTRNRDGKVTCSIKAAAKCTGGGTFTRVACPYFTTCLDAADTGGNLEVSAPGDSGSCVDRCAGVICAASDQCHVPGTCDPATGTCSNPQKPDGATCDAGVDARPPLTCSSGTCGVCVPAGVCSTTSRACAFDNHCPTGETCSLSAAPVPRFVDNGDGTLSDRQTCMVWEKKGQYDNAPVACPGGTTCDDPHDADNVYTWCPRITDPDRAGGSVATDFLTRLNDNIFAGHADWRLPDESGRNVDLSPYLPGLTELETVVDMGVAGCGGGAPCTPDAFNANCTPGCSPTDPTCSCTVAGDYWSATWGRVTSQAWAVGFDDGQAARTICSGNASARATRGGMPYQNCEMQSTHNRSLAQAALPEGFYASCFDLPVDFDEVFACQQGANLASNAFSTPIYERCLADRGQTCGTLYNQAFQDSCPANAQQYCTSQCQGTAFPSTCYDKCVTVAAYCDQLLPDAQAYCEATNPINQ